MKKSEFLFGVIVLSNSAIAGSVDALPDDTMAKAELESIVAKSDPGCVVLSSFKIKEKGAKNIMGTDLYEFTYDAVIESKSNCLLVGYAGGTGPVFIGFQGAKKNPGKGFIPYRELKPDETVQVQGKIVFGKTVEGWKTTRGW